MAEFPDVDRAAVNVARTATMGDRSDGLLSGWLVDDQIAVYEWAKTARRPFLNTVGDVVPDMWAYPSLNDARAFLTEYRDRRQASFEAGDTLG